jgi:hypothetical protein
MMTASASTPTTRRCAATTAAGSPCRAWAGRGSAYCRCHDPDRREQHLELSAKGGRSSWRTRIERVATDSAVGGLLAYLTEIMAELRRPGLEPEKVNRLRAAVYAASVAVRVVETAELAAELDRLRDLVDVGSWRAREHQA